MQRAIFSMLSGFHLGPLLYLCWRSMYCFSCSRRAIQVSVVFLPPGTTVWFVYTNFCSVVHLFGKYGLKSDRKATAVTYLPLLLLGLLPVRGQKTIYWIWVSTPTRGCRRCARTGMWGHGWSAELGDAQRERGAASLWFGICCFSKLVCSSAHSGSLWLHFLVV